MWFIMLLKGWSGEGEYSPTPCVVVAAWTSEGEYSPTPYVVVASCHVDVVLL